MNKHLKTAVIGKFRYQMDLARALGMTEDHLSKIVHERVVPTQDEKDAIAEALGCSISEIFPTEEVES